MLELIDVKKSFPMFGTERGQVVLDGVNLKIEQGQSVAVVGPSGCGKSTLLNIVGVLDKADSGKVIFEGRNLADADDNELAKIRNTRIGFVFQLHHLLPQLNVLENVLLPTIALKEKVDRTERAVDLLERVGLGKFQSHRPGELSGGQRQRVAVVRAMINEPVLLLADEPTGALDKEASDNIAELLCEINKDQKVGLVVVTHSSELAERMSKVMVLDNGKLME